MFYGLCVCVRNVLHGGVMIKGVSTRSLSLSVKTFMFYLLLWHWWWLIDYISLELAMCCYVMCWTVYFRSHRCIPHTHEIKKPVKNVLLQTIVRFVQQKQNKKTHTFPSHFTFYCACAVLPHFRGSCRNGFYGNWMKRYYVALITIIITLVTCSWCMHAPTVSVFGNTVYGLMY